MRDITMVFTQATYQLAAALRTKISTLFLHHLNCKQAAAPPPGGGNGGEFGGGLAPPPSDLPPNQAEDDDEFGGGTDQPRSKSGGGGGRRLRSLIHRLLMNSLWLKFFYLFSVSLFGFFLLLILDHNKLKAKSRKAAIGPFDLFFMSASATTLSSMATAEMEDFTNAQLIVVTILMFVGGEIFTSMIHLQLQSHTHTNSINMITTIKAHVSKYFSNHLLNKTTTTTTTTITTNDYNNNFGDLEDVSPAAGLPILAADDRREMECTLRSFKCLGDIMVGYLVIINLLGSLVVLAYVTFAKKARKIIVEEKGLNLMTFSVFAVVSSFANCGFLPTNENMIIFREHSFLCFLLMFLMLIGNTLFPPCLNLVVWALSKITNAVSEIRGFLDYESWMKKCRKVGLDFEHLLPVKTSLFLMGSVFGFIGLQFLLYCVLEWNDLKGLDVWSKVVDGLFQAVSIRHAGEAVFDLSSFSPAILVFFMIMMYIPAYVFVSPVEGLRRSTSSKDDEKKDNHDIELLIMTNGPPFNIDPTNTSSDHYSDKKKKKKKTMISDSVWYWCKAKEGLESVMPSGPVVYLVLFVMIACITEREHMQMDPLNFNFLTVAFEITSTFGSVGLSMGYSCKRLLQFESSSLNSNNSMSSQLLYNNCEETTASFCSKWSREGQILILLIMFYARLKNLTRRCGKAWITL